MPSSPEPQDAHQLDAVAVAAALRRLARASDFPWLHGEVARRMAERLEIVRLKPDLIVDWGGQLGVSGPALQQAYPKARRIVIEPDTSWAERSRAAARTGWWPAWRHGAAIEVKTPADEPPTSAQLIWSNMVLHAVNDLPQLFERWQGMLRVGGFVMFSCLGPGTLRELRAIYARLGWPAPAPGFVDMHDLGDMMMQAGFSDPVMDQEILTLRYASAQAALDELRALGGNTAPDRMQGLRTPRWRRRLESELDALKAQDGKLGLTFEVAYGHAFKAAPRLRAGEATTVSLADMRAMVRSGRPAPGG